MEYNTILKINGCVPPTPDENGIIITSEKLWSEDTGRSSSGLLVGDLIAIKTTIEIHWHKMKGADVDLLDKAINDINAPFFEVEYYNQNGVYSKGTFYSASTTYNQRSYTKDGIVYSELVVKLVEQ